MRLKSEIWVAALIRRAFVAGATAAVLHRGDEAAGAIFVVVDRLDGTADLYVPALGGAPDGDDGERRFERLLRRVARTEIAARIASERRFDGDLWAVEIEDRDGRCFILPEPEDGDAPRRVVPDWPPRG